MKDIENILKGTRSCIFLTSAGMSAESGIPTFRDKEGYWRNFPVFKEKGLDAIDLASPSAFRSVPHHAWAFYEWRRRNATENTPHDGYRIINRLINEFFEHSFVHTTNTDNYHLFSGLSEDMIYEVHGNIFRLQCMKGIGCSYAYRDNQDVPLCELDYERMSASDLPMCPECGGLLRPNVLMFGDFEYVEHAYQYGNFRDFINHAGVPDVAFLIGSSGSIPTNDHVACRLQNSGTKVITINPDPTSVRVCTPELYLQRGASEALQMVEDAVFGS
ncbi:SIR2 family NAD-dependent protein deacylase [Limisalsivibrio acetivorans]|uniref:SIR2 family NAD-dependent protein deacylase n=1 Tax=Limisalsivibrio acetivorans TaxID=1304888 RepID=UPI0003B37291|nr:Sir2 family NAD-dependent protein deacetylase [Limisalsivibrio acetivorans]